MFSSASFWIKVSFVSARWDNLHEDDVHGVHDVQGLHCVHHGFDSFDPDHGSGGCNPCDDECGCTRQTPKNFPPKLFLNLSKIYHKNNIVHEIPVESNLLFSGGTSSVSRRKTFDRTEREANINTKNSSQFISANGKKLSTFTKTRPA